MFSNFIFFKIVFGSYETYHWKEVHQKATTETRTSSLGVILRGQLNQLEYARSSIPRNAVLDLHSPLRDDLSKLVNDSKR